MYSTKTTKNNKMEEENTIKVKKSCLTCKRLGSIVCPLGESYDIIETFEIYKTKRGHHAQRRFEEISNAEVRCDSFSLSKHLKIDEDGEENATN